MLLPSKPVPMVDRCKGLRRATLIPLPPTASAERTYCFDRGLGVHESFLFAQSAEPLCRSMRRARAR